ncbi:MAG: hypothetical protein HOF36_05465 [Candidatus Marinimicrobia bacterium]|nr:hypothetical protein [Candidatus Neomarinimicrobiota bacterium]MBT3950498.1 hypothetical protein [Candidatus Neomarinimicrobiota bacterium]
MMFTMIDSKSSSNYAGPSLSEEDWRQLLCETKHYLALPASIQMDIVDFFSDEKVCCFSVDFDDVKAVLNIGDRVVVTDSLIKIPKEQYVAVLTHNGILMNMESPPSQDEFIKWAEGVRDATGDIQLTVFMTHYFESAKFIGSEWYVLVIIENMNHETLD